MALGLELGIDEVYYTLYARFPQASHFDHPPMVGWLIRFTTGNFIRDSEFFIRLAPVFLGSLNVFIFYKCMRLFSSVRVAVHGAILFMGSIYSAIICGVFIMPDTGMLTLWLSSLYFAIAIVYKKSDFWYYWLAFGIGVGAAMTSKYHSAALWLGMGLFIILEKRSWLLKPQVYVSALLSALIFYPIIQWNYDHNFISFTFHQNRIGDSQWRSLGMLQEIVGAFAYNGPINFCLIVGTLIYFFKKKTIITKAIDRLLIYCSFPIILFFIISSNWSQTLPHWAAPAYTTLLLPASFLFVKIRPKFSHWVKKSFYLLLLLIPAGMILISINYSFDPPNKNPNKLGRTNFTLDLSQWNDIASMMKIIHEKEIQKGNMSVESPLLLTRWFPGGHHDFYIARQLSIPILPQGDIGNLHEYYWHQQKTDYHGKAYFITTSHLFQEIDKIECVKSYHLAYAVPVISGPKISQNLFVYIVEL